ncbi:MAG: HD domain-containing protein [Pirellulales bacterium]
MSNDKLRRQIAYEAARMLYARQESELYRARLKAARRFAKGWVKPEDLPTNREIRDEIQLLARIREGAPDAGCHNGALVDSRRRVDRFAVYRVLLAPLETVKQDPERHPEGDALYHSLQVFDLARGALPYDEEFQLAALLHDVGKAIDPRDHVAAALEALDGTITERTAWLIENHPQGQALRDGTLGARARRRLEGAADFDDLVLLCDCDRAGRRQGVQVPDVEDALAHLRELSQSDGMP